MKEHNRKSIAASPDYNITEEVDHVKRSQPQNQWKREYLCAAIPHIITNHISLNQVRVPWSKNIRTRMPYNYANTDMRLTHSLCLLQMCICIITYNIEMSAACISTSIAYWENPGILYSVYKDNANTHVNWQKQWFVSECWTRIHSALKTINCQHKHRDKICGFVACCVLRCIYTHRYIYIYTYLYIHIHTIRDYDVRWEIGDIARPKTSSSLKDWTSSGIAIVRAIFAKVRDQGLDPLFNLLAVAVVEMSTAGFFKIAACSLRISL